VGSPDPCYSFIPYCSSDVWSGASPKSDKSESLASQPIKTGQGGETFGKIETFSTCL
jgi:hypothetical protein